jgi:hypothetical protein
MTIKAANSEQGGANASITCIKEEEERRNVRQGGLNCSTTQNEGGSACG